jgi:hypothetical protein
VTNDNGDVIQISYREYWTLCSKAAKSFIKVIRLNLEGFKWKCIFFKVDIPSWVYKQAIALELLVSMRHLG